MGIDESLLHSTRPRLPLGLRGEHADGGGPQPSRAARAAHRRWSVRLVRLGALSVEAPDKTLTANEILSLGGVSDEHYLVEIKGKHQDSFEGKGDQDIHLHEGSKFISVFTGPTPVADSQPPDADAKLTGASLFAAQLRAAGYDVTELPDHHVKFPYTVNVGKHAGLELEMGFVVPVDFPMTPPHGPQINKLLHPNKGGGEHPGGGIHPSPNHSKHFGPEWQHWSRPHPKWAEGPRTVVRYMAFIHSLWANQ